MLLWKFLHVASMFLAVLFFDGPTVAFWWAARRRDVRMLRGVNAMIKRTDVFGILSILSGVGFGVATGLTGGFDFSAAWLVLSYGLLGATMLTAGLGGALWFPRVEAAAEASPDDVASPELEALLRDPRTVVLTILPPTLFFAIIFVMVTKPI